MKTKILLLMAALIGAAAVSANAGVRFGITVGLPAPVVVSPPVVYATTVTSAPVVVQTVPPCPGANYVWVTGYWSYLPTGRLWVPGAWQYRPAHVTYVNVRHDARNRHDGYNWNNGHDRDGHRR